MPWIESHTEVGRHRKTLLMARELGIPKAQMVGHLHLLWHAALEQQEDGDLSEWPDEMIAEQACYESDAKKFVELLIKYKFLEKNRFIHDWLDYAGRYLKFKYHTANPKKLKAIFKLHKSTYRSPKGTPKGKTQGDPPQGCGVVGTTTGEVGSEKERGSGGKPKDDRPENLPDSITANDWTEFERMRKRVKAPLTDFAAKLTATELRKLEDQGQDPRACLLQSIQRDWKGVFPVKQDSSQNGRRTKADEVREKTERAFTRPLPGEDDR